MVGRKLKMADDRIYVIVFVMHKDTAKELLKEMMRE